MPRNKDGNSYFGPSALVLLVTIFTIIFVVFNFGNAANMNASYAAVIALQLFLYGASAAIYMSLRGSALWEKLNFRPSNIRNIGVTLVVTVIVILLSVIMKFVIFLPGRDYFMFSFFIGKEFLFRSIVYSEFRSLGVLCSVVITSVLYAMMHLSFQEFFIHFAFSVLWTYLAYVTDSFIWPFISHLLCNFYFVFGEKYVWSLSSNPDGRFLFWLITISVLLLMVFILFAILEYKYKEMGKKAVVEKNEPVQNSIDNWKTAFLSKPVFIETAVFLVVAIIRLF